MYMHNIAQIPKYKCQNYFIARLSQLVEGVNVEPGALIARRVQWHPHGVPLQLGRQPLVHRHVLVTLQMKHLCQEIKQMFNETYGKKISSSKSVEINAWLFWTKWL